MDSKMNDLDVWRKVMRESRNVLIERLNATEFATTLRLNGTINKSEWEQSKFSEISSETLIQLLDILVTKDRFWDPMLVYLTISGQESLKTHLEQTYRSLEQSTSDGNAWAHMNSHKIWTLALSECRDILSENLDGWQCATELRMVDLITRFEYESITKCGTSAEILLKLLDVCITKDNYWTELLRYLAKVKQEWIVEALMKAYNVLKDVQKETGQTIPLASKELENFVKDIRRYIIDECQPIEKVWRDLLPNILLPHACVGLNILSLSGRTKQAVNVDDYDFLCTGPETRIVIEGDPGIGKTTWMCNLAVNWARQLDMKDPNYEKLEKLQERFDVVFYIPLGMVNAERIVDAVMSMTERSGLKSAVENLFSNPEHRSRVLLLLDGFEELNREKLKELDDIINLNKFREVKTVIATRPSHSGLIRKKHMTLKVNGFLESQAEKFIKNQGLDMKFMTRTLYLDIFCQNQLYNPLQLSALCVVARYTEAESEDLELLDSADGYALLIEWLMKHMVNRFDRRSFENKDECFWKMIKELGPLALSKAVHDKRRKNLLSICGDLGRIDEGRIIDLALKAGIIVKKFSLSAKDGSQKQDVAFIHHVITEFIAAFSLAELTRSDERFCDMLCDTFYDFGPSGEKTWQHSPLFYFLSKFSEKFATIAFQKFSPDLKRTATANRELSNKKASEEEGLMTLSTLSIPWFARLPDNLSCPDLDISYFRVDNIEEYSVMEILKVVTKQENSTMVEIHNSKLNRCLPKLLTIANDMRLLSCDFTASSSKSLLPAITTNLFIQDSLNISSEFSEILRQLDRCAKLMFGFPKLSTLNCFSGIGSMKNLKDLRFFRTAFMDAQIEEWCEAAVPKQSLHTLGFGRCDFSALDAQSLLKMSNTIEAENLYVVNCRMNEEFGYLFTQDGRLSASLTVLYLSFEPTGMYDSLLQSLKHLSGLRLLSISFCRSFQLLERCVTYNIPAQVCRSVLHMLQTSFPDYLTIDHGSTLLMRWYSGNLPADEKSKMNQIMEATGLSVAQFNVLLDAACKISGDKAKVCDSVLSMLSAYVGEMRSYNPGDIQVVLAFSADFTVSLDHLKPIFLNEFVSSLSILDDILSTEPINFEHIAPAGWKYISRSVRNATLGQSFTKDAIDAYRTVWIRFPRRLPV